jgi:hypothetical protein
VDCNNRTITTHSPNVISHNFTHWAGETGKEEEGESKGKREIKSERKKRGGGA